MSATHDGHCASCATALGRTPRVCRTRWPWGEHRVSAEHDGQRPPYATALGRTPRVCRTRWPWGEHRASAVRDGLRANTAWPCIRVGSIRRYNSRLGASGCSAPHRCISAKHEDACNLGAAVEEARVRHEHGAHGVVVSHPLSMREALDSIPSVSTCSW